MSGDTGGSVSKNWLIGSLFALILAIGGFAVQDLHSQIIECRQDQAAQERRAIDWRTTHTAKALAGYQRIAALEVRVALLERELDAERARHP